MEEVEGLLQIAVASAPITLRDWRHAKTANCFMECSDFGTLTSRKYDSTTFQKFDLERALRKQPQKSSVRFGGVCVCGSGDVWCGGEF